ncbi:MAG TPA: hypothetical protein QGF02_04075 [Candidatus Babeliales bacterium]|nr:hypothetical protein [Candidatus Babeliales bacterium]
MTRSLRFLFYIMLLSPLFVGAKQVDMVIYSFDRPMQLASLLRSMETYMTGLGQVSVVYRSSDAHFEQGYEKVKENFSSAVFYRQGKNPRQDFVPLSKKATFGSPNDHVVFAVDDIIVTRETDLEECAQLIDDTGAYGFYLRLGKNINYCYMQNLNSPMPSSKQVTSNAFQWNFKQGKGDWAYPNSLDLVVYRKDDIKTFLDFRTTTPILVEVYWSRGKKGQTGLCYDTSKMINLPVNIVAEDCSGRRNARSYTTRALLEKYLEGYEIDIEAFYHIDNRSPHEEHPYSFIKR